MASAATPAQGTDAEAVIVFWNAPLEALFDQKVVAKVRDCSEALLERERWEGKGPQFYKLGRLVRYKKADVLAWLNARSAFNSTSEYTVRSKDATPLSPTSE